jgi:hypothetical protein
LKSIINVKEMEKKEIVKVDKELTLSYDNLEGTGTVV